MSANYTKPSLLPVLPKEDRSLVQHPQFLGIYPSLWWWTWARIAKAAWVTGPIAAVMVVAALALAPGPLWTLSAVLMVPLFSLGITERVIRTVAQRRHDARVEDR
jgi:hypothetical protein